MVRFHLSTDISSMLNQPHEGDVTNRDSYRKSSSFPAKSRTPEIRKFQFLGFLEILNGPKILFLFTSQSSLHKKPHSCTQIVLLNQSRTQSHPDSSIPWSLEHVVWLVRGPGTKPLPFRWPSSSEMMLHSARGWYGPEDGFQSVTPAEVPPSNQRCGLVHGWGAEWVGPPSATPLCHPAPHRHKSLSTESEDQTETFTVYFKSPLFHSGPNSLTWRNLCLVRC